MVNRRLFKLSSQTELTAGQQWCISFYIITVQLQQAHTQSPFSSQHDISTIPVYSMHLLILFLLTTYVTVKGFSRASTLMLNAIDNSPRSFSRVNSILDGPVTRYPGLRSPKLPNSIPPNDHRLPLLSICLS